MRRATEPRIFIRSSIALFAPKCVRITVNSHDFAVLVAEDRIELSTYGL
jgi:hypothetical protein